VTDAGTGPITESPGGLPDAASVLAAAGRIAPYVHRTPVLSSHAIDELAGGPVHFKCEPFQRSGSFKLRGALSAVTARLDTARRRGVITHSSGNHGAALALAGRLLDVAVTVVVPEGAATCKRDAVARYGARLVDCGPTLAEREAALAEQVDRSGALFVPPYDHPDVIAGQGTAALELLQDVPAVRTVWVPVGGGGLAAGTVLVCAGAGCGVHAGEPALADDAARSLASGERQPPLPPRTVADGLRTSLGVRNFEILRDFGLPVTVVSEEEILAAQRLIWQCLKVVTEASSAVALAALLAWRAEHGPDAVAGIVLTGGNVDLPAL
jgi:threonine dehydratase